MPRKVDEKLAVIWPNQPGAPAQNSNGKPALIYGRVSHVKQRTQGHGLDSQEHRCREYAKAQGYRVEAVFPDDVSGGGDFMNRPGMMALLRHLQDNPQTDYIVIFDDLKRFARDTMFHWKLRYTLESYGASVECLNYKFEDTPEGEFMETVFAAQGQLERQQNRRQTIQKMRARLENGYWVFQAPVGYRYQKVSGQGNVLVRDEPRASIVQEALEGYASGRFQLQAEVKRFLEGFPEFPNSAGNVRAQQVTDLLTRVLYAGFVEAPNWQIKIRRARHEGLISFETYQTIQARLKNQAYAPARKNVNEDFPLRGFIACGECGHPLTASWSKGRNARHPYYMCFKKGCGSYRKSIKRETIEDEFETLLRSLQPTKGLYSLARAMFNDLWEHRMKALKGRKQSLESQVVNIDRQIEKLLDRILDADSQTVSKAFEQRINNLEKERLLITEKAAQCGRPFGDFDATFRTAMDFLSNPWNLWKSDRLEDKRAVLKLTFADRLSYVRGEGFRTAKTTLPFKVLGGNFSVESKMARPEGFEPPTTWFVARYSIQLSYGRKIEARILVAFDGTVNAKPIIRNEIMAEREGFEPSMELLTPYSLSRGAPSATRPSLQERVWRSNDPTGHVGERDYSALRASPLRGRRHK